MDSSSTKSFFSLNRIFVEDGRMKGQESCCHIIHHRLQLTLLYETPWFLNVFLTTLSQGMSHGRDTSRTVSWPLPILLASCLLVSASFPGLAFRIRTLLSLFSSSILSLPCPTNSQTHPQPTFAYPTPTKLLGTESKGHPFSSLIECMLLRTQVGD